METKEAINIFKDHLTMKDGAEFIWKDYEDAALHILTVALDSNLVRKERDTLRNKQADLIRVIELAEEALQDVFGVVQPHDSAYKELSLANEALSEIRKLKGE